MHEPIRQQSLQLGLHRPGAFVSAIALLYLAGGARTSLADGRLDAGSSDGLARARLELARPARTPDDLAQVAGWLDEAVVAMPSSFDAHLLLAQVTLRRRRALDAVPMFTRACELAHGAAQVFPCSLGLAEARVQAGQYELALREYRRHVEIGNPGVLPWVLVRCGELHMALGDASAAQVDFANAIEHLTGSAHESAMRDLLVRAMLGKSVAQDRGGHVREARQTLWRALALDTALSVLDSADDEGRPFVPDGERLYYRGLAHRVLGESGKALRAFEAYRALPSARHWQQRVDDHLLALVASGAEAPVAKPRQGRVAALATLSSQGPIPAPMIDAAWRSQRRLLHACLSDLPGDAPRVVRLSLVLDIDSGGRVRSARVKLDGEVGFGLSDAWRPLIACVEKRVEGGLRLVKPTNKRRTSAWVELVLAISRQP